MGYFAAITDLAASMYGNNMSAKSAQQTNETSLAIANADNQFNSAEAAKNRAFQEEMADTQMTRRMDDLRHAGLNPGLAYQQGGAAAPSGSSASSVGVPGLQNPGAAYGRLGDQVASALDLRSKQAQIDNLQAQTNKANVEAGTEIPAQVKQIQSLTGLNDARATEVNKNVQMISIALSPAGQAGDSMYAQQYRGQADLSTIKAAIAGMDQQERADTLNLIIQARNDENKAIAMGMQNVYSASDSLFARIMAYFKLASQSITGATGAAASGAGGLLLEP